MYQNSLRYDPNAGVGRFVDDFGYTTTENIYTIPDQIDNVSLNTTISSKIISEAPAAVASSVSSKIASEAPAAVLTNPINLASSATNYVKITGVATGAPTIASASGTNANTNLSILAKGSGTVSIDSFSSFPGLGYYYAEIPTTVSATANAVNYLEFTANITNTFGTSRASWTSGTGFTNNTGNTITCLFSAFFGSQSALGNISSTPPTSATVETWYILNGVTTVRLGRKNTALIGAYYTDTTNAVIRIPNTQSVRFLFYTPNTFNIQGSGAGEVGNARAFITIQQIA
jgi:hypothetical protein